MGQKAPLFRGQGFRLASVGVGLVVGLGIVLIVQAATSNEPLSSGFLLGGGAVGLIIAVVAVVVGLLLGSRIFGQRLEIALRTAGETKWQHGRVEVSPGTCVSADTSGSCGSHLANRSTSSWMR